MMPEPVDDPAYWAARFEKAVDHGWELHRAIFHCPHEVWTRIEDRHREILKDVIGPSDSVLDCGCGYGRLLTLMPGHWAGAYLGVDLSPMLVKQAQLAHDRLFMVGDLRDLSFISPPKYDWAILISVRPMIVRNMGPEAWDEMEAQIRTKAKKLLYLEYDENDKGRVE